MRSVPCDEHTVFVLFGQSQIFPFQSDEHHKLIFKLSSHFFIVSNFIFNPLYLSFRIGLNRVDKPLAYILILKDLARFENVFLKALNVLLKTAFDSINIVQ
jgi:hypothetical protein